MVNSYYQVAPYGYNYGYPYYNPYPAYRPQAQISPALRPLGIDPGYAQSVNTGYFNPFNQAPPTLPTFGAPITPTGINNGALPAGTEAPIGSMVLGSGANSQVILPPSAQPGTTPLNRPVVSAPLTNPTPVGVQDVMLGVDPNGNTHFGGTAIGMAAASNVTTSTNLLMGFQDFYRETVAGIASDPDQHPVHPHLAEVLKNLMTNPLGNEYSVDLARENYEIMKATSGIQPGQSMYTWALNQAQQARSQQSGGGGI